MMKIITKTIYLLFIPFLINAQVNLDSIAEQIGNTLEDNFNESKSEYLISLIDENYLTSKFLIRDKSNADLTSLNERITKNSEISLAKSINRELEKGVYYNFISYYTDVFNNYYLIFRLYSDEGINYHEYHLLFDKDNKPKIGDIYVYLTGELYSETLSRIYYPSAQQYIKKNNLDEETKKLISSYETLGIVFNLINKDKLFQAWILYNTIPEEVREKKIFLIAELRMLTPENNEEKYSEVLKRFNDLHPSNPSYYLLGIDMYIYEKKYSKSLEMVDNLEAMTNDDFLNLHRGNLYYLMEDYPNAEKAFQILTTNYPSFEDGFTSLLLLYNLTRNFKSAIEVLDILISKFEFTKEELIGFIEEEYLDLSQSDEYLNWKNT